MTTTAGEAIADAARRLRASGSTSPRMDAQLLLSHATTWSRSQVLAHPERVLAPAAEHAFLDLVTRRAESEPIAYLVGEREFYGHLFRVDRRALIPRPETELLVDIGREAVARWRSAGVEPTVVDVGTGCGGVAISLAAAADVEVIATDVSAEALCLAAENAQRLAPGRVTLRQTNLLDGLAGPLHVILANLPYVPNERRLPPDVANFEPSVAIFGGPRGTELIEQLLRQAQAVLVPGGEVAVELDEEEQAMPIATLARELFHGPKSNANSQAQSGSDSGSGSDQDAEVVVCQDGGGYDRVVRVIVSPP